MSYNQRMRYANSQYLQNLLYPQYVIKQRKVQSTNKVLQASNFIINLMNETLNQAAYLRMSVAERLATNDLCEQRMHYAHTQRLKKAIDAKMKK